MGQNQSRTYYLRRRTKIVLALALIAVVVGIVAATLYESPSKMVAGTTVRQWDIVVFGLDSDPEQWQEWEGRKPFSQTKLLDVRARSDAIALVHLNTFSDTVKVVQVPRDTYVPIPGVGWDKVTKALFDGGTKLAKETLFKLVPKRFEGTVLVDYSGFERIIDAIGGVTIEVYEELMTPSGKPWLYQGTHTLNGKQALRYIRHRYGDPRGDLGRLERQQQFLQALRSQLSHLSPTEYLQLFQVAFSTVKTDLSLTDIMQLGNYFVSQQPKLDIKVLPGESHAPDWNYYPDHGKISSEIIPFLSE